MKNKSKYFTIFIIVLLSLFRVLEIYKTDLEKYFEKEITINYSNKDIEDLIDSVTIGEAVVIDYDRNEWERPAKKFVSFTGEKQSIREYSISISYYKQSGIWEDFQFLDPYTEEIIEDESLIEYDHIIPLAYAATHGGQNWTTENKNKYSFDLDNGIPCSTIENRIKGSKGPSEYLPEENEEEYCYTWLIIADEYDINISKDDMNVIKEILSDIDEIDIINKYKFNFQ